MKSEDTEAVHDYLTDLQKYLCAGVARLDPDVTFIRDTWARPESGGGESRAFVGKVFEKGGINFSDVCGTTLPPSATERNPELSGRRFRAMGVSAVIHPFNPYVPTSHMNVRFIIAEKEGAEPVWWFGGGFDLTPYYGFAEDAVHWHTTAREACINFGENHYPRFKQWCDRYFYIKHRMEPRGIGGLFFDDYAEGGFDHAFGFMRSVGDAYWKAYAPIVTRRMETGYGEYQRRWQTIRRGRYVEFNLVYDRGTHFGLQSGGRTESILMSLPPEVRWEYSHQPEPGTPEADLLENYLIPKEWI